MATVHLADYPVTTSWTDVVATVTGAASVDAVYQNVGQNTIAVVFAGGSAPTTSTGILLGPFDSVQGNAANVWARTAEGSYGESSLSVATV